MVYAKEIQGGVEKELQGKQMSEERRRIMLTSYEKYLKEPKSLTVEEMRSVHEQILGEIADDMDAKEIYEELVGAATKYASFRSQWFLWDRATRIERDDSRTSCHNSLIVKFDMLARYLKSQNKDAVWRETLGYEKDDRYNRKAIGDFACYLVFINSINAR